MHFYRPLQELYALTFDLDDTLYDNRPVIARTEHEAVQFLQHYHPALRCLEQNDYQRLRRELRQREPEIYHDVSHWRWRSIKLAIRNAGLSEREARVGADAAMEVVLRWRSQIDVPAETHSTLAALSTRWPLVAITNGNASPEACGLAVYFHHILRAGPDGRAKPWHDMYALAAARLNVPLHSILHVGDDLEADVTGAIRSGMQACWINDRGGNVAAADARLLPHLEISRPPMDVSDLLNSLNDKQREAVAAPRGNLLVLAGAGSGKTRVLVHRIAWLLSVNNCPPYSVMAVTFTNKAAAEMRHRIEHLVGSSQGGMWTGTFHGLAHRLLRAHPQDANLPKDFQILDSEDQMRLLKRLIRTMKLDEKQSLLRQAMWYISGQKGVGLRPQAVESYGNPVEATLQRIYQAYQEACNRAGLLDFAELLLRAHELWLNKPHILRHYRERFTNILVDEFQDTNQIQYAWIRMLAGNHGSVMIVGDDDQSIYGWRGAQVENIQRFLDDFPGAQTIRLEQNYRSTSNILQAANALIAHNRGRLGKNLWTKDAEGEPITLYCAYNELDEARFVVNRIKISQEQGGALKDCSILYRSNAQSRVLEEALLQTGLPYRIYGGMRFFERQEIKDALAYLRLIANRNDDAAYERAVNTPTRGLGDRTLDVIRQTARDRQLTLWQSSRALLAERLLTGRGAAALQRFLELIDALAKETEQLPLHVQADLVIRNSGLYYIYEQEKGEKSQVRIENLKELVTAARQFSDNDEDQNLLPLQAFLSQAALEAAVGQTDAYQDAVQLMTLHSAKGLEFPQVFIVGMEEGMFPSQMSLDQQGRLEEERRLAYVGVTRAMGKLTITYAQTRRLYGKEAYHRPSRFVCELPAACVEEVRLRATVTRPASQQRFGAPMSENDSGFTLGQRVRHPKFGEGTVVNLAGGGEHSRLQIAFQWQGIKWLVAAYARLETV